MFTRDELAALTLGARFVKAWGGARACARRRGGAGQDRGGAAGEGAARRRGDQPLRDELQPARRGAAGGRSSRRRDPRPAARPYRLRCARRRGRASATFARSASITGERCGRSPPGASCAPISAISAPTGSPTIADCGDTFRDEPGQDAARLPAPHDGDGLHARPGSPPLTVAARQHEPGRVACRGVNEAIRIIGIDPGPRRTGWGVVESLGSRLSFVAAGTILPQDSLSLAERLCVIHDELQRVMDSFARTRRRLRRPSSTATRPRR